MSYDVVFYVDQRGNFPVIDFLASLNVKEAAKYLAYMEQLQEHGNRLPSSFVKPLGDGLWELRPESGGTEFRLFYFTVLADTIVMLHAIRKKTRKIPESDIDLARKRKAECTP